MICRSIVLLLWLLTYVNVFAQCDNILPITIIDLSTSSVDTSIVDFTVGNSNCCPNQNSNLDCGILEITVASDFGQLQLNTKPPNGFPCSVSLYDITGSQPCNAAALSNNICGEYCNLIPDGTDIITLVICGPNRSGTGDIEIITAPAVDIAVELNNITQNGCDPNLSVSGLNPGDAVDWSSSAAPLSYLDCGSGPGIDITCQVPIFSYTGPTVTDCAGQSLSYTVAVTDPCTMTSVSANQIIVLYPEVQSDLQLTCDENGANIAVINSNCPGYLYEWSNGSTSQEIIVSPDDSTYSVQVTNPLITNCNSLSLSVIANCADCFSEILGWNCSYFPWTGN